MGCSLVKSAFLVYCVIKRIVDHAPRLYLYCSSNKVPFNTSEIIALLLVSSIRLLVRFD